MEPTDPQAKIRAARDVAAQAATALQRSVAFRQLPIATQTSILGDMDTIRRALKEPSPLATPFAARRPIFGPPPPESSESPASAATPPSAPAPRAAATETLATRAGALSDEIDFPSFVGALVHGTFDAMLDASIRQMETYASLVASIARSVDDFTRDNVDRAAVMDWLVQRYPRDLAREVPDGGGEPRLVVRSTGEDGDPPSPAWLSEFGLEGEPLTQDLLDEQVIPAAATRVGEGRLQTLATMVLLGINRIVVRDGSIDAKVRFRASARDRADVTYSTGPQSPTSWGDRGALSAPAPSMLVSTVGVNVQAETDLKAELFGEVKINFASETVPLERFADAAQVALLQRHAGRSGRTGASQTPVAEPPAAAPAAAPAATLPAEGRTQ